MDKSEFLTKYKGDEVGYWADSPARLFWARLFDSTSDAAVAMAKDFLLTSPEHESSSLNAAREVLGIPKMLNSIAVYVECGKRAAVAMNQSDAARHTHESSWFRKARGMEVGFNKDLAQRAYDEGYRFNRAVPAVDRFS